MDRAFWTIGVATPVHAAASLERYEQAGWDGVLLVDSQNLSGDPYVALALGAHRTTTLGLGTGVTNPYTRHPAATACSIATVQAESGGRAVLGIGRGDSSLAHLGLAPSPLKAFEIYLRRLQGYLRGDEVPFTDSDEAGINHVDALGLHDQPTSSKIRWLPRKEGKVPVDVAATGPKVIAIAARHADYITLAVGANEDRLRWGMDVARTAREAAGLDPAGIRFNAYVNVVVDDDKARAKRLVSGGLATFARFAVMHGTPQGPASADVESVLREVHARYDMTHHTEGGSSQTDALTDEFVDSYAVIGTADRVAARLTEMFALGLERLVIIGPSAGVDREAASAAQRRFTAEVIPALKRQ